ncbi:MAG: glycoside hydrolase family 20 zincin-like fold domain-containing protein [Acidimicrobiales bacterium]
MPPRVSRLVPELFPQPRHLVHIDRSARSSVRLVYKHDRGLPQQGYELEVSPDRATLAAGDEAGRRYGEQAVAQLRDGDGSLPSLHLRDWPDIAVRGYMLDVSRDRVPTQETLGRLVEVLALARFNHLQLYVEHTFAYPGHEAVWRDASGLSGGDLEWLDRRCAAVGIELAVNQNTFGHMERWLRHDAYRSRAECRDGIDVGAGKKRPPSVLAPTPENAAFAVELCRAQLGHVRSGRINIGCDETFDLGRGVSAARAARVGTELVYVEHVARIMAPLVDEGYSILFWGDMLRSHPHLVDHLPNGDITAVAWTYESPCESDISLPATVAATLASLGFDLDAHRGFAINAAPFAAVDFPFWVAPGTSSWNSLVGRLDNARENILDAAQNARTLGARGLLLTDWGDGGHHQPLSVSYPPIAYAGAVSWCADANERLDLAHVVSRFVTNDPTGTAGRALVELGSLCRQTGQYVMNGSPLHSALFPQQTNVAVGALDASRMGDVLDRLETVEIDLSGASPRSSDGSTMIEELRTAARLARHGALRLLVQVGAASVSAAELHADLAWLVERYRADWARRSRPGGLDDSVAHFAPALADYAAGTA